nr:reverse transcriptase domain-containing protein [Tanacetum cinerariifolium]
MTAHHNDWDTSAQRSESSSPITSSSDPEIIALKAEMVEINKNLMKVLQINQVKSIAHNCETCSGPHSYNDCPATVGQTHNVYAAGAYNPGGTLPSNTVTNPMEDLKGITTRTAYKGPTIPTTSSLSNVVKRETEVTKDTVPPTNNESTKDVQYSVVQIETPKPNSEPVIAPVVEPVVAPVSAPKPNQKPSIPYPSRLHDQKLCDKANDQKEKFFQIFKDLDFNIKKLGEPGKFLIPCDFLRMDECLALADLGASVNLMPLSVWNKLSLPELTPTLMTLELAEQSISQPIDVTFNLDQTLRYSANYNDMTTNQIDVINMACEEYSQEVLGFSNVIASGNPTPYYDPIVSTSSPTLTPFRDSDFLLEEVDAFLALEDDPNSSEVDHSYYNTEGDILLLEVFLNDDPSLPLPTQGMFGTPRAIISDRSTYFCNDQFAKVMLKYGVTLRLATAYHPQTSRQVEVSNRGLKRILERTVGENRALWSDKLDDAPWAFRTVENTQTMIRWSW